MHTSIPRRWCGIGPTPHEKNAENAFNLSVLRGPTMQTGASWLVPAPRLELGTP